jgi:hypothetical protein
VLGAICREEPAKVRQPRVAVLGLEPRYAVVAAAIALSADERERGGDQVG